MCLIKIRKVRPAKRGKREDSVVASTAGGYPQAIAMSMNLDNIGGLNPMAVSECSKSIGTDMAPDFPLQHRGGLNVSVCDEARENDPCGVGFQLYYCCFNSVIHLIPLSALGDTDGHAGQELTIPKPERSQNIRNR